MYKEFLELIKQYNCIAIFRHVRPDGDAMFSTLALYSFLKDNFKDKKIKVAGNDEYDIVNKSDKISDSFIKRSLAIVLDTSNRGRVDDERFLSASYIVKIDHHPVRDNFGDLNIVDHESAATCEIIARIFLSREFKDYYVSEETCRCLYCGLITDTINFSTTNVTYRTLEIAYKLVKKGNLKVSDLVEYLMDKSIDTFKKVSKIRNYLEVKEKFGYICLDQNELNKLKISPVDAKNNIDEIGRISDLLVWAFAVQEEDCLYNVSVRSKRGYRINTICEKYGGGGHANACGVKGISKKQLNSLFKELIELSTKNPENIKKSLK